MKPAIIESAHGLRANEGAQSALRRAFLLTSFVLGGCAIEGDDACGPHQVYQSGGEILEYAVCVCDEAQGYVIDQVKGYGCKRCPDDQAAVGGKCVAPASDAGMQSDASDEPKAPTGIGEYCESPDDCKDFDAKYCAVQVNACLLDDCATGINSCISGTVCCDFSKLVAGFSLCLPNEQLTDGNCPMMGVKVEQ